VPDVIAPKLGPSPGLRNISHADGSDDRSAGVSHYACGLQPPRMSQNM
jgi:hypothetical protein